MRPFSLLSFLLLVCLSIKAQNIEQTIKVGKTHKVKTLVNISGGQLKIKGGSEDLADVRISYDKYEWNPTVSYTEDDKMGKLTVKASTAGKEKNIDDDNKCSIVLNKKMTYAIGVVMGAGLADLDFEGFNIEKALFKLGVGSFNINLANTSVPFLKIDAGIGEANLDLSGDYKNNLKAQVNAGIGELTITVPQNIGIQFEIDGFLGDVDADGFKKKGDLYTNRLFGQTKYSITMTINGAIGSINIKTK